MRKFILYVASFLLFIISIFIALKGAVFAAPAGVILSAGLISLAEKNSDKI